jgi:hypothetical protein
MYRHRRTPPGGGCRVYVGGLHRNATVKDVEKFFEKYSRRFDVRLKDRFGFIVIALASIWPSRSIYTTSVFGVAVF